MPILSLIRAAMFHVKRKKARLLAFHQKSEKIEQAAIRLVFHVKPKQMRSRLDFLGSKIGLESDGIVSRETILIPGDLRSVDSRDFP